MMGLTCTAGTVYATWEDAEQEQHLAGQRLHGGEPVRVVLVLPGRAPAVLVLAGHGRPRHDRIAELMTVTAHASGTQTTTVTTEHFLSSPNVAGTFTLHVDANPMAAGDVVELRVYQMVLTGGTQRVAYYARYDGVQPADDKIKISVPISNELTDTNSLRFSLLQTKGTTRDFPWKVLKYA